MKPVISDAIARMRNKFLVKGSQYVGMAGGNYLSSTVEKDEPKDRVVEIIATTMAMDLDDEVVDPAGADWSYFNAAGQKKVFQDHWYDSEHNVGVARSVSAYMEGGVQVGWKMRVHVYTGLKCPYADDLWAKIPQGGMGLSIGFVPIEISDLRPDEKKRWPNAERIIRRWKVLEVSFTPMPANVTCQTGSTTGPQATCIEIDSEEIEC